MACADIAEALFNSTFDHRGKKAAIPFATENDLQGLLTMVCYAALTGGEPILFADYRKVYEPWEIQKKADELGIELDPNADYMQRGTIDMDNSGSGSLDWVTKATSLRSSATTSQAAVSPPATSAQVASNAKLVAWPIQTSPVPSP